MVGTLEGVADLITLESIFNNTQSCKLYTNIVCIQHSPYPLILYSLVVGFYH